MSFYKCTFSPSNPFSSPSSHPFPPIKIPSITLLQLQTLTLIFTAAMGAAASSLEFPEGETGLGDLPESCAAEVLRHLDPRDICRLARLSRAFRAAASGDPVWGAKLPANYRRLMMAAEGKIADLPLGMKHIYAGLTSPNSFDGGNKEFWLGKSKGGFCMSISWKALSITGIDDRRHWTCIPTEESRFHTVAYLQQIWWFEVGGEIEFDFPVGEYSLYIRLHLGRSSKRLGRHVWSPEHIHGWDKKPVKFLLSTSDGQGAMSQFLLDGPRGCWIHYNVGDFVVRNSDVPTTVKFTMKQIDCTHTKGGLSVDCVFIYPKGYTAESF